MSEAGPPLLFLEGTNELQPGWEETPIFGDGKFHSFSHVIISDRLFIKKLSSFGF